MESQNDTKPSVCRFFSYSCESPTGSHNVIKKPTATLPQHNKPQHTTLPQKCRVIDLNLHYTAMHFLYAQLTKSLFYLLLFYRHLSFSI